MQLIYEGVLLGLTLAIMLGPIFIAITQTSIEKGYYPGLTVGLGIWVSDFLFICASIIFVEYLKVITDSQAFVFWVGLVGGIVLMLFGISIFIKDYAGFDNSVDLKAKNYLGFFTKGFLVNTINPFTVIFWFGISGSYVISRNLDSKLTFVFFASVFGTIMLTDWLKIRLAKWLRNRLKVEHLEKISKFSGIALFLFGIVLLIRTFLY